MIALNFYYGSNDLFFKILIQIPTVLVGIYFAKSLVVSKSFMNLYIHVHNHIEIIKKGRGNRPIDSLATLNTR